MITEISINNFKLFKERADVPLSKINLLTGINGKGKSSVLQAFLLLNQSALSNRAADKIILNGLNVKLGSIDDVKNKDNSHNDRINIGFKYDEFNIQYSLFNSSTDASELLIENIEVAGIKNAEHFHFNIKRKANSDIYDVIKNTPIGNREPFATTLFDLFIDNTSFSINTGNSDCEFVKAKINLNYVHYVSADRIGPKNYYENKSLGHFVSVGALGQNTVNVLHHKGSSLVHDMVLRGYCELFNEDENEVSKTIEDNTNLWIDKIFQGAKVEVTPIKGEDLLKLRINSDGGAAYFKPTNVGYGFSYSLPIIVAGLTAKPGEILIVENPEAHLHPYAQSVIAKFLALVANTGVQVLIESHSEHILNGLRVAVKLQMINNDDLNVLYFQQNQSPYFDRILVDKDGGIENWPLNFFDQSTNDLNYLLGI